VKFEDPSTRKRLAAKEQLSLGLLRSYQWGEKGKAAKEGVVIKELLNVHHRE